MAVLSERDDRTLQMTEIAAATSASLSRLSHAVTRMESQGFMLRERLPGKGRRTNAILTDAGYAKVAAAAPGHVRRVRQLFIDPVSASRLRTMREVGEIVLDRIDPTRPDCLD
jgi:DNA-binding MarR family transcriptional regulator